jgi:hypothetical protein
LPQRRSAAGKAPGRADRDLRTALRTSPRKGCDGGTRIADEPGPESRARGGRRSCGPDEGCGATSPGNAVSLPPLTRDSGPGEPCVMCEHIRDRHRVGTDGAGWCAEGSGCDCGGFQGRRTL